MSQETNRFEFGDYVLDTGEKILLRDGKAIPVPPKVLDLLVVLVENHGSIVAKEDLMDRLWADTYVEESNLTFSIRKLRKILGDDAQNPQFIETIPKRGYRFIGARTGLSGTDPASSGAASCHGNGLAGAVGRRTVAKTSIWRKTFVWFVFIVTAFIVGSGMFYLWKFREPSSFSQARVERLTYNGKSKLASISPDGRFVAYILEGDGGQSIWLKNAATGSDVEILPPSEASPHSITFSPDGDHIYYVSKDTLYRLPILGGASQTVLLGFITRSQLSPITFSPDGREFAFIRRSSEVVSEVIIVGSDGSGERILATGEAPRTFLRSPVWSPDGKVIALLASGPKRIAVIRLDDGSVSDISTPSWTVVSQIAWTPDGTGLFAVATEEPSFTSQIWHLSYPEGRAENITKDLNNYQSISVTRDGSTIAAVRVEQIAHIWAGQTEKETQIRQLTHGIDSYDGIYGLEYLPTGKIVYEAMPGAKGQVWSVATDGTTPTLVSNDSGFASVSPDGRYVVLQGSDGSDGTGLFRLDIASGEKIRLTKGKDVWIDFSPDGKWIAFSRWEKQTNIWKLTIGESEPVRLTDISGLAQAPAISPDGKFVAFHWSNRGGEPPAVAVIDAEKGVIVRTFEIAQRGSRVHSRGSGKDSVQWTFDGKAIDYALLDNGASNIWRQPLDGNPPFQVTTFNEQQIFNFAYSPDGKKLALSRGTYARDVVLLKFAGK